jgi:hypothetical protein
MDVRRPGGPAELRFHSALSVATVYDQGPGLPPFVHGAPS